MDLPAPADFREDSYSSTIIDAYSSLEGFLREAASSYARSAQEVVAGYDLLPEALREQHMQLSLSVLGQRGRRHWASRVDMPAIVRNLSHCLDGMRPFRLNDIVFEDHRDVFRHSAVESFLARLAISLPANELTALGKELVANTPLSGVVRDAAGGIDLLADRRNEISHGVTPVDLLSHEILLALVDLVAAFGTTVFRAMLDSLASFVVDELLPVGEAIDVFKKPVSSAGVVVGVRAITPFGRELRVGEWLVAQRHNQPRDLRVCRTNSIEVSRERVDVWRTDNAEAAEAGVWLDRPVRQGWLLCPIPQRMRAPLGL